MLDIHAAGAGLGDESEPSARITEIEAVDASPLYGTTLLVAAAVGGRAGALD